MPDNIERLPHHATNRVGFNIRRGRRARLMTYYRLADRIGIEPSELARYESGDVEVPPDVLKAVASIFRIEASELTDTPVPSESARRHDAVGQGYDADALELRDMLLGVADVAVRRKIIDALKKLLEQLPLSRGK